LNRNSERIPVEDPPWWTCGGVSEQIKNRLYSLRSKIPRPLCGGELQIRRQGKNLGVKMPIYHEICRILNENKSPKEAIQRLVKRDLKDELNEDYQLIHRREK